MAKIVYVCARDISKAPLYKQRVAAVTQKLVPDNISGAPCRFYDNDTILYGISVYTAGIAENKGNVCMGIAYPGPANWCQPLSEHPDGSFAIFRSDNQYVEAVADVVASRSIWYYKDEDVFIAGTSQRAVIAVAGSFNFDKRVIPWILSTGTIGPSLSWCKNIGVVKPGGTVLLDRTTWALTTTAGHVEYKEIPGTEKEHRQRIRKAMQAAFEKFNPDFSKWILPISGGYDSRGILCMLKKTGKDTSKLNSITWGLKAALQDKSSDAYVGTRVAETAGLQHRYFETDHLKASVKQVFDRYIHCSEGRVDHIPGYMDGFAIWKNIYESGSYGVIRGDESFGWHDPITELNGRLVNDLTFCSDYSNLEGLENYGYEKQELPAYLERREGESINVWADRLYEEYTIPVQMSALNDLKLSYTEVINPLLSAEIIHCTLSLPDRLRDDKKLFKEIVNEFLPQIKFATRQATADETGLFAAPEAVALMSAELAAPYMKLLFPEPLLEQVITGLNKKSSDKKKLSYSALLKNAAKKIMPNFIKEKLRAKMPKRSLDNGVLAFRIYMAGKTYRMLMEDVKQNDTA